MKGAGRWLLDDVITDVLRDRQLPPWPPLSTVQHDWRERLAIQSIDGTEGTGSIGRPYEVVQCSVIIRCVSTDKIFTFEKK